MSDVEHDGTKEMKDTLNQPRGCGFRWHKSLLMVFEKICLNGLFFLTHIHYILCPSKYESIQQTGSFSCVVEELMSYSVETLALEHHLEKYFTV